MKTARKIIQVLSSIFILLSFSSCLSTPTKGTAGSRQLDPNFLTYWYDAQIMPAITQLSNAVQQFEKVALSIDASSAVSQQQIDALREQYRNSFLHLQDFLIFDQHIFRQGRDNLTDFIAASPVVSSIVEEINRGTSYQELERGFRRSTLTLGTVGFRAIDYILYSTDAGVDISSNSNAFNYLVAVIKLLNTVTQEALDYYTKNRESFVNDTHFGSRGSLSVVMNTLIHNYEKQIRTGKLGYVIGVYGFGNKPTVPSNSEAYYAKGNLSAKLLQRSIESLVKFYNGTPLDSTQTAQYQNSLESLLNIYINSPKNTEINNKIRTQLQVIQQAIATIENDEIAELATTNVDKLKAVYDALQQLVGIIKTDTFVELGLTITYSDGEEGD